MAKNSEKEAALGAKEDFRKYTHEELLEEAFKARDPKTIDGVESAAKQRRQTQLLEKAGYKWVDVREVTPSDKNFYSIDDDSIEDLASMIYRTKNTTPITLRETKDGIEIVDGERRVRAHLLLGERYGDINYMVPARVFEYGSLSDEDAELMLNTMNLGQRDMTPSERAKGFAVVASMLEKDAHYGDGALKERLAAHFGVSPRAAQTELNIAMKLCAEGQELLDQKLIYKKTADALSGLDEPKQLDIIQQIRDGLLDKEAADNVVADAKQGSQKTMRPRKPKTIDSELANARNAFKRALKIPEHPDPVRVAELRVIMKELSAYLDSIEQGNGSDILMNDGNAENETE